MPTTLPHFREAGEGETTVFLLHGAYGDGRYFRRLQDHLADGGRRVVAWDCPGYGVSASPASATVEGFADAAIGMIDALGTSRNVVLGHSMGSLIAPLAVNATSRTVSGVVLSAASAGFKARTAEDQDRFLHERLDPIRQGMTVAEYAPKLLRKMMGPGAAGKDVDLVVQVISEMDTDVFERSLTALTKYDGRPALRELAVPTLLIAGECDTACPPAGMRVIDDLVADSRFHELSGVGHYGFAEDFDRYSALVDQFLAEVDG
ncbi:alpha/beta fold hydrolase [Dietzia sp. NPDC055340]